MEYGVVANRDDQRAFLAHAMTLALGDLESDDLAQRACLMLVHCHQRELPRGRLVLG